MFKWFRRERRLKEETFKVIRLSAEKYSDILTKGVMLEEYFVGPCKVSMAEYEGRGYYIVDEPLLTEIEQSAYVQAMESLYFATKPEVFGENLESVVNEVVKVIFKRLEEEGFEKISMDNVRYYVIRDSLGYGILDVLIRDPRIEDISAEGVGKPVRVFHRDYSDYDWLITNIKFEKEEDLDNIVLLIAHKSKKHISTAFPIAEGALPEKHRASMTFSCEVTPFGSSFTIRKFRTEPLTIVHLIKYGTISPLMAAYWWLILENKGSLFIVGEMASGKTTLMNALLQLLPPNWKIVCVSPRMNLIVNGKVVNIEDSFNTLLKTRSPKNEGNTISIGGSEETVCFKDNIVARGNISAWQKIFVPDGTSIVRIITESGVLVEVTENTRIPVLSNGEVEYKYSSQLAVGDLVPVLSSIPSPQSSSLPIPSHVYERLGCKPCDVDGWLITRGGSYVRKKEAMDNNMYYLMGFILGKGELKRSNVQVEVKDRNLAITVLAKFSSLVNPVSMEEEEGKITIKISHGAGTFIKTLLCDKKTLTEALRTAGVIEVSNFVAGLLDALMDDGKLKRRLEIEMPVDESEALAEALLKIGVKPVIRRRELGYEKEGIMIDERDFVKLVRTAKHYVEKRRKSQSTRNTSIKWETVAFIEKLSSSGVVYDITPSESRYYFAGRGGFIAVEDTIEDTPELRLPHVGWKPLVARHAITIGEAITEIDLFDLVRLSLRERAQFIVVGEIRGEEAYVFIQSLAAGHGGMCTFHGDSLESMVMRLTTPPINVPLSFLPLISNVVIMRYVRLPRRKPMRRVQVVEEVSGVRGNELDHKAIFKWIVERDEFTPKSIETIVKESVKLKKVRTLLGWDEETLIRDLEERKRFLEDLARRDIAVYTDVVREVRRFYSKRMRGE